MTESTEHVIEVSADEKAIAEREVMEATVQGMLKRGYVEVSEINNLKVGARVCHSGQRWYEARVHGTATIERIFHMPVSSWSQKYGREDIELIAKRDKPEFGAYGYWADYHTVLVSGDE